MRQWIAAVGLVLALIAGSPLLAEDKIGEAVYLDGDVAVVRNGESLDTSAVQVGMDMRNFDLVKTGSESLAEIQVSVGTPLTISISPDTQFSFELSRLAGKNRNAIGLITGSLRMKVSKLTATQEVKVQTETTVMGVRGTQFTVSAPPSGDILITCDEGEVVCTDEGGAEFSALPGIAVEKRAGALFRTIPVAVSDLETFRNNWMTERISALKANALKAVQDFAGLYATLSSELSVSYASLMKNQGTLQKWYREDKAGQIGGTIEVMREKKEIVGDLFKLRKTLFIFERVYYRLLELKEYNAQGYGRGLVEPGLSTDRFFQRIGQEGRELERKMATIRYVTKLYALRNGGAAPTGAFDEDQASGDDFFGGTGF
jgi:hypothetical protein